MEKKLIKLYQSNNNKRNLLLGRKCKGSCNTKVFLWGGMGDEFKYHLVG